MLGSDLKLVGRQTPTQTGWLDLLAIDQDGRLVVYELKTSHVDPRSCNASPRLRLVLGRYERQWPHRAHC